MDCLHSALKKRLKAGLIKLGYLLPFSPYRGLIWFMLDKSSNQLLDVGCGGGGWGLTIKLHQKKKLFSVGMDLYPRSLRIIKSRNIYDEVILADARYLPFKNKGFDTVTAIAVIEHLTKEDALLVIKNLERIARKQVLLETPVGFTEMFPHGIPSDLDPLKAQLLRHRSGWLPSEFRKMGYAVRGEIGPFFLPINLAYFLSFLIPITYYAPNLAHTILVTKRLYKGIRESDD